jgi:vacuolar-type H+-ATPase subunit E/Vma4
MNAIDEAEQAVTDAEGRARTARHEADWKRNDAEEAELRATDAESEVESARAHLEAILEIECGKRPPPPDPGQLALFA